MFRAFSLSKTPLRSLTQTLISIPHSPTPFQVLSFPYSQSSNQKNDTGDVVSLFNRDPESPPKLFVVQPRLRPDTHLRTTLDEALNLANSLEEQRDGFFDTELCDKELPPHVVVQNPASRTLRADTYFGAGTVETIKCHLSAEESKKAEVDAVFVNAILSGVQQRNLERAWGKPVLDRVGLIIEIFNAHAQTKEAKLQAELAALMYKKTRLVRIRGPNGRYTFGAAGEAEVVSARGRGSGGRGFISGAGETELQLQRRRILERQNSLLSQIEEVRRTRALQRAARKRRGGSNGQGLATVAVVGYTNAGKSTLVSSLSETDLYSDDRLFATVDPRLRSVVLPSGRKVLLSDTVGFISDLPVQLVEAFHATLEEVAEADLLVHVLDSSAPNLDEQRSTVLQVLVQIGVSEEKLQNMIEVWNKIDMQEGDMAGAEYLNNCADGEAEILNEEEDDNGECELSPGEHDNEASSFSGAEDDDNDKRIDIEETMDDKESDYSDGWLSADDDQHGWNVLDNQQTESSKGWRMENDSRSQGQHVPHVKTSAIMGVGLQELLQIVDEKLKTQDENPKAQQGEEHCYFDRKWRPRRTEDAGIAVEQ